MLDLYCAWAELPRDFAAQLAEAGWEPVAYEKAGDLAGIAVLRGPQVHFAVKPGKTIGLHSARAFCKQLMARHGYLTTSVLHVDQRGARFPQFMGFKHAWSDDLCDHYMLSEEPLNREN